LWEFDAAMKNRVIFVTGGARSGKSNFAQKLANGIQGNKVFVATAEALDEEMKARIASHQKERPSGWDTIEEAKQLSMVLNNCDGKYEVILIDCVTIWISNLLVNSSFSDQEIENELKILTDSCKSINATVIIVSNEVGSGIVPDNKLSRVYRDIAGKANQEIARIADEVYLVVAGISLAIKSTSVN
jgi:adenosylcobinamide kinase/adenosylcobinamide-phosphate guanylyltransferase